jgi:hypothetical protein
MEDKEHQDLTFWLGNEIGNETSSVPPSLLPLAKASGVFGGKRLSEYTTDDTAKISQGAIKYDGGKSPIFRGAVGYFPRALGEVAAVSAFGATKYAWKGWEGVPQGFERYSDALVRHLASEGKGELEDRDSGLLHAAHAAWNALARLELLLRDSETVAGIRN